MPSPAKHIWAPRCLRVSERAALEPNRSHLVAFYEEFFEFLLSLSITGYPFEHCRFQVSLRELEG